MEGLYIKSIENVFGEKPSGGINLDAVLAKISASKFCDLGTNLI